MFTVMSSQPPLVNIECHNRFVVGVLQIRALILLFLVAIRVIVGDVFVVLVDFRRLEKLAGDWRNNATEHRHDICDVCYHQAMYTSHHRRIFLRWSYLRIV